MLVGLVDYDDNAVTRPVLRRNYYFIVALLICRGCWLAVENVLKLQDEK